MLNEKRVKHMVKLAMYEHKEGTQEIKTSSFYKKDYISFNMLWSVIWATIAYIILVAMIFVAKMEIILNELSLDYLIKVGVSVLIGYVIVLILYIPLSRRFYKKKHARAYYKTKHFKEGLNILEEMYQEEKKNG